MSSLDIWTWVGTLFSHAAALCFYLTSCSLGGTALKLGEGDPWMLTKFLGPSFSLGTCEKGFLQASLKMSNSVSWGPGLWACLSPFSFPSESGSPPSLSTRHGSKGCLWCLHTSCWGVCGPAQHLSLLTSLSLGRGSYHQCTSGTSWVVYVLMCCPFNIYQGGWRHP